MAVRFYITVEDLIDTSLSESSLISFYVDINPDRSGSINHANLINLNYSASGHTGFEPARGPDDNYITSAEKTKLSNLTENDKGFYGTPTALRTAHPTGQDGWKAVVGSTDTVWVWDSGTADWVDTDTKGQVSSVNGQTGAITGLQAISEKGQANGYPSLGSDGKVPQEQVNYSSDQNIIANQIFS